MLSNQKPYFPDIIDMTMHFAYEVHWKGGRKEEPFDFLPEPWKGINVFIEDFDVPETIIVRMPGFYFARISETIIWLAQDAREETIQQARYEARLNPVSQMEFVSRRI